MNTTEQVQWRNIKHVITEAAKFCFGSADHPQYGSSYIALVNCLSEKDGLQLKLDPLPKNNIKDIDSNEFEALMFSYRDAKFVRSEYRDVVAYINEKLKKV